MAVYTVHEPPPKPYESAPDPERFVFVRDGFSFWACVFGPLWMLRHWMWLVFSGYVIVAVALDVALRGLGVSAGATLVVGILLALLIGFEAPTLRRFTLTRRKWTNVGVIVGDDLEAAERRFFDTWTRAEPGRPMAPSIIAPRPTQPYGVPDVIGLFPDPGGRR